MVNLLLNFLLRRNINSEKSGKLQNSWHWLTISSILILAVLALLGIRDNSERSAANTKAKCSAADQRSSGQYPGMLNERGALAVSTLSSRSNRITLTCRST